MNAPIIKNWGSEKLILAKEKRNRKIFKKEKSKWIFEGLGKRKAVGSQVEGSLQRSFKPPKGSEKIGTYERANP
jgi:hypothetical protein